MIANLWSICGKCGDEVEIISLPYRNYVTHLIHNLQSPISDHSHFDILLQDELNHPSLFLLNRFIKGRYPIISIVHHLRISEQHPSWQNMFYGVIERAYLNSVDGFIFNSEATKKLSKTSLRGAFLDEAISDRDRHRDCFAKIYSGEVEERSQ